MNLIGDKYYLFVKNCVVFEKKKNKNIYFRPINFKIYKK